MIVNDGVESDGGGRVKREKETEGCLAGADSERQQSLTLTLSLSRTGSESATPKNDRCVTRGEIVSSVVVNTQH